VFPKRLGLRRRTLLREPNRRLGRTLGLGLDRIQILSRNLALLFEEAAEPANRVPRLRLFYLFFGPVALDITHGVAPEAVGQGLDEIRSLTTAGVLHSPTHHLVDGKSIGAVHALGWDIIGTRLSVHLVHCGGA